MWTLCQFMSRSYFYFVGIWGITTLLKFQLVRFQKCKIFMFCEFMVLLHCNEWMGERAQNLNFHRAGGFFQQALEPFLKTKKLQWSGFPWNFNNSSFFSFLQTRRAFWKKKLFFVCLFYEWERKLKFKVQNVEKTNFDLMEKNSYSVIFQFFQLKIYFYFI